MTIQKRNALPACIILTACLALLAGTFAMLAAPAAGMAEELTSLSQLGGPASAVAADQGFVYLGAGPCLYILDASDPANPALVGTADGLRGNVSAIALSGGHAFVTVELGGLYVINIADPAAPSTLAFLSLPEGTADIAVAGGYAYVVDWLDGVFRVIRVADPAAPAEVGQLSGGFSTGIAVEGNLAFVTDKAGGLIIVNVADPAQPYRIGVFAAPGASSVFVEGDTAYVTAADDGLLIVNVADPSNPTELGRLDTPGSASAVTVRDGFAYVADGAMGFRIMDVENPAAPAQVGFVDTPGDAQDIALANGSAFAADGGGGLRIIRVSNPAAPVEVGSYDTAVGHVADVAIEGNRACLAGFYDGLSVVEISDPASPAQLGLTALPGFARSVAAAGGIAYVACQTRETGNSQTGGMSIVSVLDPANPVLLGHFPIAQPGAYQVALKGATAFIAAAGRGVHIVDVSDPARPGAIGVYDTRNARGIAIWRDFACVADFGSLKILDVADPAQPVLFKTLDVPAEVVAVSGDLLFAAYESTVRMIYLSTYECTRQIAEYTLPAGTIKGIAVSGGYVFLTVLEEGVRALRISDSYTLSEVAAYDMLFWPNGVAVSGGDTPPSPLYVHVATARLGLNILSFVPRAQEPTPTPRPTPTPHPPTRYQYFYPFVLQGQYPPPLCGP